MSEIFNNNFFSLLISENSKTFMQLLNENKSSIVIFGAGEAGQLSYDYLMLAGYQPICFCDNSSSKQEQTIKGKKVISFNRLCEFHKKSLILIASPKYCDEMQSQLKINGFKNMVVIDWLASYQGIFGIKGLFYQYVMNNKLAFEKLYQNLSDEYSKKLLLNFIRFRTSGDLQYILPFQSIDDQYFEHSIVSLTDKENFIDGGAYIGDTVDAFLKHTNGKFNKIYSFEPCSENCKAYRQKFEKDNRIKLMPYGLWDKRDTLHLITKEIKLSNIITENSAGTEEVPVISIDEALCGEAASFIKMDIEGSEFKALHGAKETIKNYKPKLAICVYHKPLDIVEIPLFIKSLVPEYKLFLRHYTDNHNETVLYAVAK